MVEALFMLPSLWNLLMIYMGMVVTAATIWLGLWLRTNEEDEHTKKNLIFYGLYSTVLWLLLGAPLFHLCFCNVVY